VLPLASQIPEPVFKPRGQVVERRETGLIKPLFRENSNAQQDSRRGRLVYVVVMTREGREEKREERRG
jgi:hypothetical protein